MGQRTPQAREPLMGAIDDPLAGALARASETGPWDVVARLARELEARWLAAAGVSVLEDRRTWR
jgi:hypothetical protein